MSNRGIYYTKNGSDPIELSDEIEPFFTDAPSIRDLTGSRTVLDQFREKLYIFIPGDTAENNRVLSYDYYWKEWFVLDGIDASGGLIISDDVLYHASFDPAGKFYGRIDEPTDDGVAFRAYWASAWHTLGAASFFKKFIQIILWNKNRNPFAARLVVQKDWNDTVDIQDSIKNFVDKDLKYDLKAQEAKSMRFFLDAPQASGDINYSGYEIEYEINQTRAKG
jgi:hypothetical protein